MDDPGAKWPLGTQLGILVPKGLTPPQDPQTLEIKRGGAMGFGPASLTPLLVSERENAEMSLV